MLPLAREAGRRGGTFPCAYNAANEVAVQAFLDGRIGFLDIASVGRGRARTRRRLAGPRPGRTGRGRPWRTRPDGGGGVVSLGVAILGLAVLILIHEAGHFVAARAVGMRPRKFYLGFGPPIVKTVRNGVEYGIAAFPLGGYVKIPGMHRPAAGDLRQTLKPEQQEQLRGPLATLDQALEAGDDDAARAQLPELQAALGKNRVLEELEGALAPDAYWRQGAWKQIVVIAAGPLTNIVFAVDPLHGGLHGRLVPGHPDDPDRAAEPPRGRRRPEGGRPHPRRRRHPRPGRHDLEEHQRHRRPAVPDRRQPRRQARRRRPAQGTAERRRLPRRDPDPGRLRAR